MKKHVIIKIIFILLIATSLGGCADVLVTATIGDDYAVGYRVVCSIDIAGANAQEIQSISDAYSDMIMYYTEHDYTANMSQNTNAIVFTATKQTQCASYSECFDTLFTYMTDVTSPLSDYSYEFVSHYFYDEYSINASTNTTNIINTTAYDSLPEEIQKNVKRYINDSKYKLVFDLPNHTELSSTDQASVNFDIPVSMNTITPVSINGRINNIANINDSQALVDQSKYYKDLVMVLSIIVTVLLAVIILAIVKLVKPKKQ